MAQFYKDFRAETVGAFSDPDFSDVTGSSSIVDNSYSEGNALLCSGATWSSVAVDGFKHPDTVEVAGVIAIAADGSLQQHSLNIYTSNGVGTLNGGGDSYELRLFGDTAQFYRTSGGSTSGLVSVGTSTAPVDGDALRLVAEPVGSDLVLTGFFNAEELFSYTDTTPLPVPAGDGIVSLVNRSGQASSAWYSIGIGTNGDAAPTAPVSGGTDALTADDLQSTSSVTSPAIGQEHAILADDNSSNSTVSQPALGQEHSLLSDGNESASTVSSPSLSESNVLLANDLQSASSVSSPTVRQEHGLLSDNNESASSVSQPAIGQSNGLVADDLSSNSTVSSPALAEVSEGDLLADDLESASTVSSPAIGQEHALPSDSLSSNSTVSSPTLTEGVGLNANNLESASTVSSPAVGQIHVLAANDEESASTVSSPQVGQVHVLNADSLGSSSTVTQPTVRNPAIQFDRPVVNPTISINNTVYGIIIDNEDTSVAVNQ